ncbi:protein of unknown function [Taphrina deformans PYCC 5710]|uniref:NAD-dependent epimerase/dehydratase domain-containing protein n=1 Tax=Taphrina deformans (strain PYCC 5710 / ATCC 11124 / CBS 356.35 / IMI 108563 / JCM 9778 / NBRC 8474) TaxID=1097556 RepID=R4XG40_TAPDE|nr:protein of unknown function [Taphrina deformans PYCC 5710]|eukprot:CCG84695.1 protein of unknown function [Taphrina deformans PYCC 5710]
MSASSNLVLVSGGSGFLALHCIAAALRQGYRVRTTVRSPAKEQNVLKELANAQPPVDTTKLEFVVADLLKDEGWNEAAAGAEIVLHVASPFPLTAPKHEDELIKPAVEGTLRVLRAAKASGTVRRVVVTSSVASISYGTLPKDSPYTEEDWSDPDGRQAPITAYAKSKTLAEKAAWDYVKTDGKGLEMATVNPVGIFGPPMLVPTESSTCGIVQQMLDGAMPAVPNIKFGFVDVRDVADLHMLAATTPGANGQRYIAVAGKSASLLDMSNMLRTNLGAQASKAPTRQMPNFLVKFLGLFMTQLKDTASEIGIVREFDNSKAKALGWTPRSNEESIISCAKALLNGGSI